MQVMQLQICQFGLGPTLSALRVSSAAVYHIIELFPLERAVCRIFSRSLTVSKYSLSLASCLNNSR